VIQHRRSIRLQHYDYTQPGAYFITLVTKDRLCLFGKIVDGDMVLSEFGKFASSCWDAIPEHFPFVEIDSFVVMPNHIHGIFVINATSVGATHASPLRESSTHSLPHPNGPPSGSVGAIIGSYRSAVSKRIHQILPDIQIWQRNYYERIIRNEKELDRIRQYILNNPLNWSKDQENRK